MAIHGAQVERWSIHEISLFSRENYGNPYRDVVVSAVFTGPDGVEITREAFWCGGNGWKVRFAPTAAGKWSWRTVCSNPRDSGLHARTGDLICVEHAGCNPIYLHGFLRIANDRRHFAYNDGTPFFWLGDTHWQMPDTEMVNECNHPEHAGRTCAFGGQFQHLLSDRSQKCFNVYQTYPSATAGHWWTAKYTLVDPRRFNEVFDLQMNRLASEGFVIALGVGHFNSSLSIPQEDLCRWARYLVARYGAHPVVWITCQEMNAPEEMAGKPFNRLSVWKAVAETISACDGYKHPHSAHQWVVDASTRPLGREPWHTWFALQGGHRNRGLTPQSRYQGYYEFVPARPMIEAEAMYEMVDCGGVNSTDDARRAAWKAMLCGCAGYTYGAAGVWALKLDDSDERWKEYNHAIKSWCEGMALPGSAQMTVLRNFFIDLEWTNLTPRFQDPSWSEWVDPERCVLATAGNWLYVAYFYGSTSRGALRKMDPSTAYRARWFNPRTGEYLAEIRPEVNPANGTWAIPEKPDGNDWTLVVGMISGGSGRARSP